ncbi:MAG: hypothetical protein LUC37_00945 [Prevotella sp.]|nr:hypothetical protein [Prevotella sp.]
MYDQLTKPYSKEWNTFRRNLVKRQDTILKDCEVALKARIIKEIKKDFDSSPKLHEKLNRMAKKQCKEIVETLTEKPTKKKRRTSSKQKKQRESYTSDFVTEILDDVKIGAENGVEESVQKKGGKMIKNKSGYANSLVQQWEKTLSYSLSVAEEKVLNEQKKISYSDGEEMAKFFTAQPFYYNIVDIEEEEYGEKVKE